nr:helix-turn-helix domain-containing protein [Marinomonas sp. MED121]
MNSPKLTEGKRYLISVFLKRKFSVSEIAYIIKCHRDTIYRELLNGIALTKHIQCVIRRAQSGEMTPSDSSSFSSKQLENGLSNTGE